MVDVNSVDGLVRDYTDLADLLWNEREVLDQLLFELTVEQLVVSSGQTRWLPRANRRLHQALEQLRAIEVSRSIESDGICDDIGLPTSATLAEIAGAAPPPWDSILLEHRQSLLALAGEVRELTDQNRRLLDAAARSVRETLASITASVGTYDAQGAHADDYIHLSRVDEQA